MTKIKRVPRNYCKCGCGGLVKDGNVFICGHNTRGRQFWSRQQERELCLCGCGGLAQPGKKFIYGHSNNGRQFWERTEYSSTPCLCGCGEYPKIGSEYKMGHASKNVSDKTRMKLSKAAKSKVVLQSTRDKLAIAGRNRRWTEETYLKMSGPNHPNWRGGISLDGYCPIWKNKEFREMILERDGYKCQNPLCWGTSKILTLHHIDHNRMNCHPTNIITTCNSCNPRANFNREFWYELYTNIISEKMKLCKEAK